MPTFRRAGWAALAVAALAGCAGPRPVAPVHHRRVVHHHRTYSRSSFAEQTRLRCRQGDRGACRMLAAMGE